MSQENVELVRSAVEAYNAGPEAYLAFMAEDIEVRPDASVFPEAKPFRGRDEFRRFLAEIDEGWEGGDKLGVIREVFAVGDRVVTRTDWGGRGRASGIDLRSSLSAVFDIRDGQIIRIEFYFDHAKALEAAGLLGVGDVAGERGDRRERSPTPSVDATRTPSRPAFTPRSSGRTSTVGEGVRGYPPRSRRGAEVVRRRPSWNPGGASMPRSKRSREAR